MLPGNVIKSSFAFALVFLLSQQAFSQTANTETNANTNVQTSTMQADPANTQTVTTETHDANGNVSTTSYNPFATPKNPNQYTKIVPTPKEDLIITQSIKAHMQKSPLLKDAKVEVQTTKGIVHLKGTLDSDSQASTLVELAESIVGVIDVNTDHLNVTNSQQPFTDTVITAKIKGLFIREQVFGNKDIASMNVGVETKNGIVYLTGLIDNKEQLQNAIRLIQGVDGVKKVVYSVKKFVPFDTNTQPQTSEQKTQPTT